MLTLLFFLANTGLILGQLWSRYENRQYLYPDTFDKITIPKYKITYTRWKKGSPEVFSENELAETTEPPADTTIYEFLEDEIVSTTSVPFGVIIGKETTSTEENLVVTESLGEDNCLMRENINSCNIYLCRWLKNMLSLGFPCYRQ